MNKVFSKVYEAWVGYVDRKKYEVFFNREFRYLSYDNPVIQDALHFIQNAQTSYSIASIQYMDKVLCSNTKLYERYTKLHNNTRLSFQMEQYGLNKFQDILERYYKIYTSNSFEEAHNYFGD